MKEFNITWAPGKTNLADCHSKHHAGAHDSKARPICLHEEKKSPTDLQGCIELLHGAHSRGPAHEPATGPSSQTGTSCDIPVNVTPCNAGVRNSNRSARANQCTRLGVPTWLERASTDNWKHQLHH